MLYPIHQQIWKTQQWPQDWKRSIFIPVPKKDNVKECSHYCTIALISHASTPLQYSCLENPMDRGGWEAVVHGVAKSRTWLSDFTFTFCFHALEKDMATNSSVLAWRIPGTAEPGGLPSMGLHRVGHDWSDLAAAATHTSKVMLKIQTRLQQYVNHELQMFKLDLEKAEEPKIKLPTSLGS